MSGPLDVDRREGGSEEVIPVAVSSGSIGTSETAPEADGDERRAQKRSESPAAEGGSSVDGGSGPGCLSITQGSSSQVGQFGRATGSEDWFEWSLCIEWHEARFSQLSAQLAEVKERCQRDRLPHGWFSLPGNEPVMVARQGTTKGGAKGSHFEFVLSFRGITVLLANRTRYTETIANGWAVLEGRDCLLVGSRPGLEAVRALIRLLGGRIEQEKLTRVDLTLDVAGLPFDELVRPFESEQYITTARKRSMHADGGHMTGVAVGQSPCRLVMYDKRREVLHKADGELLAALAQRRWGGSVPDHAIRVEFSVRRRVLLDNGISSPDDYLRLRGSLAQKLTGEFFRMTDGPVDRENKHQSRAAVLPLWADIQRAFRDWAGEPTGELAPLDLSNVDASRLAKQAIGCIRRAALIQREAIESIDDLIWFAGQMVCLAVGDKDEEWLAEFRKLQSQYPHGEGKGVAA